MIHTIDQRAYIVGEEGRCPECLKEVDWKDVDTNWFLCNECVQELLIVLPVEPNDHTSFKQQSHA